MQHFRVWTHRERQNCRLSQQRTHEIIKNINFVAWKFLSLVARVLWVHFLRFPLILRKDSLTWHYKRQFCRLSLPVRSHLESMHQQALRGGKCLSGRAFWGTPRVPVWRGRSVRSSSTRGRGCGRPRGGASRGGGVAAPPAARGGGRRRRRRASPVRVTGEWAPKKQWKRVMK